LVDAEKYLLACYRYIELNPVTAAMVEKPEEYRWSSYHANAMGFADPLVSPHDVYSRVAGDDALRRFYYRELFQVSLSEHDVHCIRSCLTANQVLGEGKFKDQIGAGLKRKLGHVQQPALLGNSRRPLDASPIPPTIARAISSQSPP
jgi:putative transposase